MNKIFICLTATVISLLSSCGHILTKSNTYDTSSSVVINGAKVSSGVKPNGGKAGFSISAMIYMAGSAKLEGPFKWRIEAEGKSDEHLSMVVHRLKVETSKTKRNEWYDRKKLGVRTKFVSYKKEAGKSFAVYQIPGILKVFPKEDGNISIIADITITSKKRSERKLVKFSLAAEHDKKETEFLFFPAEIVNSFGQRDPREWKFDNNNNW